MLQSSQGASTLHPLDNGGGQHAAQVRILRETLESAAVQRTPDQVDRGTQPYMGAFGLAFAGEKLSGSVEKVWIPRGTETSAARDAGCWDRIEESTTSSAVGAICAFH